jgi:hypothetical protein
MSMIVRRSLLILLCWPTTLETDSGGMTVVSFPKVTRGLEPISYKGALLSSLLHATVLVFTQFAECTGTDCK